MLTLITGGARSGKSNFAQSLCPNGARVTYVATATAGDAEMASRIAHHRRSRPAEWRTVEEPLAVPAAIRTGAPESDIILLDCLTLWLSNLFHAPDLVEGDLDRASSELIEAASGINLIAVTNELGSGIIPESPLARRFCDAQGRLNQRVAAAADSVYLLVAGIPMQIKGTK
jgi:adenosylcobinamide kinase/adenosylcobinamide-phosphate guanylyltransferase